MKIRPLHDRILAKRLDAEGKTSSGLFIPDTAKEKPLEALVVSVGSGKICQGQPKLAGKAHQRFVDAVDQLPAKLSYLSVGELVAK